MSQHRGEETVAQFFSRHLGAEVAERLVGFFVSGVYAGNVHHLSASAAFRRVTQLADAGGGLFAGAMLSHRQHHKPMTATDPSIPKTKLGELGSFKQGLKALSEALATKLGNAVKLNWHLNALFPTDRQTYLAEFFTSALVIPISLNSAIVIPPNPPMLGGNKKSICSKHLGNWYSAPV